MPPSPTIILCDCAAVYDLFATLLPEEMTQQLASLFAADEPRRIRTSRFLNDLCRAGQTLITRSAHLTAYRQGEGVSLALDTRNCNLLCRLRRQMSSRNRACLGPLISALSTPTNPPLSRRRIRCLSSEINGMLLASLCWLRSASRLRPVPGEGGEQRKGCTLSLCTCASCIYYFTA